MKRIASSLALAIGMLAATSAFAATTTYRAIASGQTEAMPNASPGYSLATIVIDDVAGTLSINSPFADLLGTTTDAHIHCCTAQPFIGAAGVATPLPGFPLGVNSGAYSRVLDLNALATYTAAFLGANGGNVNQARDTLLDGINGHQAYLNIHTTQFPGGEIRGFLVALPAAPVPEPATYAMLGVGLAGVAFAARRKQANKV